MSIGSSKSKSNRTIIGIFGILLLFFGILSFAFQYSTTVNVYAQVNLGPFVPIGPPNRSETLDAFSDTQRIYAAYEEQGANNVFLGVLNSGAGGRGQSLQDPPANVVEGGSNPSIVVGPGGQIYLVAERPGEGDIAFTECTAANDDSCEEPQSASTEAPPIETSCFDGVDGDGDGVADELDSDCAGCFVEPAGFNFGSGEEARIQFVSNGLCPFEEGPVCDDGTDNDGDGLIDEEDPDCTLEGGHISGPNCDDGIDNDGDGLTDAEDPDCNKQEKRLVLMV